MPLQGLAQSDPQVYRIKSTGEAPRMPTQPPPKKVLRPMTRVQSQSALRQEPSLIPVAPKEPKESAAYYQWNQGNRRTITRHRKIIDPSNYLDHSVFDKILRKFVNKHGWVDYRRLKRDKRAKRALKAYVEDLSALDPSTLKDPSDRLAAWLNLYNALAISEILKHYPVKNILQIQNFFGNKNFVIGGEKWSLLEIEEKIFLKEIREPRAVLARVTSAAGGPRLMQGAYSATKIEEQLEDRTWKFLMNRQNVDFNARTHTLLLSPVFIWYKEEFGDVLLFLRSYLDLIPNAFSVSYRGYDWSLNDEKLH